MESTYSTSSFLRVGIVESEITLPAVLFGDSKVQADRLRMPDMQITVRLGGKSSMHTPAPFSGHPVFFHNMAYKIARGRRGRLSHFRGSVVFGVAVFASVFRRKIQVCSYRRKSHFCFCGKWKAAGRLSVSQDHAHGVEGTALCAVPSISARQEFCRFSLHRRCGNIFKRQKQEIPPHPACRPPSPPFEGEKGL
jgi:hypothetical protein